MCKQEVENGIRWNRFDNRLPSLADDLVIFSDSLDNAEKQINKAPQLSQKGVYKKHKTAPEELIVWQGKINQIESLSTSGSYLAVLKKKQ